MKIFGIGLSRTGTTSLHTALEILGYKSIHWPVSDQISLDICKRNFKWSIIDQHDALTDIHGAAFYREFDKEYPGSKFILTVRDEQSWLKSMENHAKNMDENILERFAKGEKIGPNWSMTLIMLLLVFKSLKFEKDHLLHVYNNHLKEIRDYFKGNFLEINITAGDGWEKLCSFLGKSIPDLPFPWENIQKRQIDLLV